MPILITNVNNKDRPPFSGVALKQEERRGDTIMSGRVLSDNERTRLQYMLDNNYTYRAMAKSMGCCTDTLKRILVREDMADFEGAKYALSPSHRTQTKMWKRPCIRCKSEVERPKWQYICDKCKHITSHSEGVPDDYIWEN